MTLIALKKLKKDKLKKMVKQSSKNVAFKKLNTLKVSHSKSKVLSHPELKMQMYLKNQQLNTDHIKFLFKVRSRMLNCKSNYKEYYLKSQNKEKALLCPLCKKHEDLQQNIIECEKIDNGTVQLTKKEYESLLSENINTDVLIKFKSLW